MTTSPREPLRGLAPARLHADDGSEAEMWKRNASIAGMKHELRDIERLADRITIQVSAYRQLLDVTGGHYDGSSVALRTVRLALTSAHEALAKVEQLSAKVDIEEFGARHPATGIQFRAQHGTDVDAIEEYANDLGIQANAQEYGLALAPSQRRPDQASLEYMRFIVHTMSTILTMQGA
ncbi:hypothetical protein AB0F25_30330 [Streptomyces wedmorensis]|uniref:hypothetical protein n=1 Tax=Streptomyces wedmorensis TaxID=43759 RepID=UPI0034148EEA